MKIGFIIMLILFLNEIKTHIFDIGLFFIFCSVAGFMSSITCHFKSFKKLANDYIERKKLNLPIDENTILPYRERQIFVISVYLFFIGFFILIFEFILK